jgi:GntR family transcriptional repressor for pyruvate dehydrogenase complex
MHPNPPGKRSLGLAHDLVALLTQHIRAGKTLPGEKMPSESMIVREHRVSRTVVREAISKLQASGLVETRHGIGTFVLAREERSRFRLDSETAPSIRGVLEVRMGLETQAAALAARRRSEAQLAAMGQAVDDYQRSLGDSDKSVEAGLGFHRLIAEATGNAYFAEVIHHVGRSMSALTSTRPREQGGTDPLNFDRAVHQEYQAIFQAIRRQDADAARAAMWLHLSNSLERLAPE